MGFDLSSALYTALDRYVSHWWEKRELGVHRAICRAHPEWQPLTEEELDRIDRRDRWSYMYYKNMSGAEPLSYFVSDAVYKTRILTKVNACNHRPNSTCIDTDFSDKNYHDLFMPELRFPETVIRRVHGQFYDPQRRHITPEEALRLLNEHERLVFKQTVETGHGEGVRLVEREEFPEVFLRHSRDYIVQKLLRQHETLAYFNPSSVNIVRITSLCWHGEVYILGGILRAGAPGAFCDHENKDGKTYLVMPLAEDGTVLGPACDVDGGNVFDDCHGIPIRGVIPRFSEMKELIRRAHIRYPKFGLIAWDVTVDENGEIVFMEFNTKYPGIMGTQCALGPVLARKSRDGVPLLDELLTQEP